jgi:hypothetical protein
MVRSWRSRAPDRSKRICFSVSTSGTARLIRRKRTKRGGDQLIRPPMLRKSKKQRSALIALQIVACLRPFCAIEAKKSRISRCVTSVAGMSSRNWQSDTTEARYLRFVVALYSRTLSQRANRDARSALNWLVEGIAELGQYILASPICQCLHSDLGLLAQSGGNLVQSHHAASSSPGKV